MHRSPRPLARLARRPLRRVALAALVTPVASAALLAALSFAYRLPPLLNAPGTNSDAAIVGLQARHVLQGEWSWFLFGSRYQTSVDAFVAALFFLVFGANAYALMLSTLCGHVVATLLANATLRRHLGTTRALLLTLPLVFTSSPVHTYVLYPPRQAALTLVFVALWLLDGAARARDRHSRLRFAFGGAAASLAVFADPYALLFAPALGLLGLLAAFDRARAPAKTRHVARRLAAAGLGAAVGAIPLACLWSRPEAGSGARRLTLDALPHHAALLVNDCLPWLLGTRIFRGSGILDYGPWEAPWPLRLVALAGATAALAGVVASAVLACRRAGAWEVRRLGVVGLLVFPLTVGGFLTSVMVMDIFSARYLVAMALAVPFALAPLAARLAPARLAALLAPYVIATAIGGWVGYGPYVRGVVPVRVPDGTGARDAEVAEALRAHGVRYAIADYWTAYRLTFQFEESPIVVPLNPSEDRYLPYRTAFESADVFAYLFDPTRSREDAVGAEARLTAGAARVIALTAGGVRVVVIRRRSPL